MIRTGVRTRSIYALVQIAYAMLILSKLLLTYRNLHVAEISVYAIFIIITPITMRTLLKSTQHDLNEYFRLLLYSIVEVSYLTETVGLIYANFLPVLFIGFSLTFFLLFVREKEEQRIAKSAHLKIV